MDKLYILIIGLLFGALLFHDGSAEARNFFLKSNKDNPASGREGKANTFNEEVKVPVAVSPAPFGMIRMYNGNPDNSFGNVKYALNAPEPEDTFGPEDLVQNGIAGDDNRNVRDYMIGNGVDWINRGYTKIIFQLPWGKWENVDTADNVQDSPYRDYDGSPRRLKMYENANGYYQRSSEWREAFIFALRYFQKFHPEVDIWLYSGCFLPLDRGEEEGPTHRPLRADELERYFGFLVEAGLDGFGCDNSASSSYTGSKSLRYPEYYNDVLIPWFSERDVAFMFEAYRRESWINGSVGSGERDKAYAHTNAAFALQRFIENRDDYFSDDPRVDWTVDKGEMPVFMGVQRGDQSIQEPGAFDYYFDRGFSFLSFNFAWDDNRNFLIDQYRKRTICAADINQDEKVDLDDLLEMLSAYEANGAPEAKNINRRYDINGDGFVSESDIEAFKDVFGKTCATLLVQSPK